MPLPSTSGIGVLATFSRIDTNPFSARKRRTSWQLVRYIHLNPLRAKLVQDLDGLNKYPYRGHCALVGRGNVPWQDIDTVLKRFAVGKSASRRKYLHFVGKGLSQGRRPDLIGGGLVRSAGGWGVVKMMRNLKEQLKGDERILGDSDFVEAILAQANEALERQYSPESKGYDLNYLIGMVARQFQLSVEDVAFPGKQPLRVQARSAVAYWAVRHLSIDGVEVGKKLGMVPSAVSRAVKRGEKLVEEMGLSLE